MDNFSYQRIKDTISKADRIAIAVGRDPRVDDMAAALSLYLALKQMGKTPSIASASQPLVEHSNLVGIDKVKSQFDGGNGDLVVSFPYKEGEIEKVSYTIDQGFLNIVVKAGQQGLTFQEEDVRFTRGGGVPNVLFIVGTPRLSDLGNLFNPDALKDTTIINIDNKRDNQGFGDVVLVSPQASSVSEEVASMLFALDSELDVDTAQNLLYGIIDATNDFKSTTTSPVAFEMVGKLMQKGARRVPIAAPQPAAQSQFQPRQTQSVQPQQQQPYSRPQRQAQPQQQQPQQQNEERVSSFMPEQSLAGTGQSSFSRSAGQQNRGGQTQTQTQAQTPDQSRRKPPSDWLTPKVYKGSSNVQ